MFSPIRLRFPFYKQVEPEPAEKVQALLAAAIHKHPGAAEGDVVHLPEVVFVAYFI
jgi:hypothetical protein